MIFNLLIIYIPLKIACLLKEILEKDLELIRNKAATGSANSSRMTPRELDLKQELTKLGHFNRMYQAYQISSPAATRALKALESVSITKYSNDDDMVNPDEVWPDAYMERGEKKAVKYRFASYSHSLRISCNSEWYFAFHKLYH